MSKEIPCPKCGHVWLWVDWKKDKDAFCPKGYGCASEYKTTISDDLVKRALADRIEKLEAENAELKAKLAWAVEALQVFADDANWFDTPDGDGVTMNPTWRGPTFTPEQFASDVIAELTGGKDD